METFCDPKEFVDHPTYAADRLSALAELDRTAIDEPLAGLVAGYAAHPHAFTLQCCWGHFLHDSNQDPHNLAPVPAAASGALRYRIAYFAVCLEHSRRGRALRDALAQLAVIDEDRIQFGSATWFWERWPNSYVLQVEPQEQKLRDVVIVEAAEARRIQVARDRLFDALGELVSSEAG